MSGGDGNGYNSGAHDSGGGINGGSTGIGDGGRNSGDGWELHIFRMEEIFIITTKINSAAGAKKETEAAILLPTTAVLQLIRVR